MRALILRRVGLIESGAGGPVILGTADNGDVLRLANFLRRNGHPLQLDPDHDPDAKALVERFRLDSDRLPIVVCRRASYCTIPESTNSLAASGSWRLSIQRVPTTWPSLARDPRDWLRRSTQPRKVFRRWCSTAAPEAASRNLGED